MQSDSESCLTGSHSRSHPRLAQDLVQCTLCDTISADPRPTWVTDLHNSDSGGINRPVFWNSALERDPELFDSVIAGLFTAISVQVKWTVYTIKGRWEVVSANYVPSATANASASTSPTFGLTFDSEAAHPVAALTSIPRQSIEPMRTLQRAGSSVSTNHTLASGVGNSSAHKRSFLVASASRIRGDSAFTQFFRQFNWASTELGGIEEWPVQLVELCNVMLACPDPTAIYWGDKAIAVYNEACIATIGDRHPNALGRRMEESFSEVWEGHFKPLFDNIVEKGQPWMQYNDRRVGYKAGRLEEVFWNVTFTPIFDEEGAVVGTWGTLYDVTVENFWRRRVATLLRLTASMNASESYDAMWVAFADGFEGGDRDVPHLLVYTATDGLPIISDAKPSSTYRLKTSFGYDAATGPYNELDINDHENALARLFQRALASDVALCFERSDVDLASAFWDALQVSRSDDICKAIIVIPIRAAQVRHVPSFLVVGLNPFVRYDKNYSEFIDLAQRQLSSATSSLLLREDEVLRERRMAEEASNQLSIWKAEAELHELRFTRLAETAPIGICTYGVDGTLTFANDGYRTIFGMSQDDDASGPDWWDHLVHPEDLNMAKVMFGRLLIQRVAVKFEIRVKARPSHKATPTFDGYVWVLVSAYAEPTGSGPQTVIACFTDINEQKVAEDNQNRRLEDLINSKRQQEAFIDMTSHEIRNPLSVVLQCTEEIISTCTPSHTEMLGRKPSVSTTDVESILDAAETIEFCTLHQKRIVDDILTLSKLESGLLPVTPDRVQPLVLVDGVMKLFEREIRKSDMELTIDIHPTFHKYDLHQVLLDPSRVSQIIINLVSNAIKFTKTQNDRRLEVLLGGSPSSEIPLEDWPVSYLPRQQTSQQDMFPSNWNPSELAYLHFAVRDTGAGMSVEEQEKIFSRFTQASPRTHVKYGGSGLGLYICRALSETHGGQIGCTSVPGRGSAFGFCVKVGRNIENLQRNSTTKTPPASGTTTPLHVKRLSGTSIISSLPPAGIVSSVDETLTPKFHILIVEDNILNQKVLRRQLERAHHTVVVAHHGQDALDSLRKTRGWKKSTDGELSFDFILMDIEMPVMNGLTCTRQIREWESQNLLDGHIPVIATTGNARDEKIEIAISAGVDKVVLKPYSLSVLLPIAHQLWQKYGRK